MDSLADMPPDAQPIPADVHAQLLAPLVTGVETALRELAKTEAAERSAYRVRSRQCRGDLVAMLDLSAATGSTASARCLALGVAATTAAALARRFLSDASPNPDAALIRDCLGEIANVAAGQAKALLHGTPHAFAFGTPRVASAGELTSGDMEECLVAVLATDVGDVVVQLFLDGKTSGGTP